MLKSSHEQNRLSWNAITPIHNRHKGDQAAFLRAGGSVLHSEEIELVGDLSGRRVAHLQCNCGQDTLGLAALGGELLGVDISDAAIDFARTLSRESGIPARFLRSDIYDWLTTTEDRFDVAFASYGALPWLSNLDAYFEGVVRILKPGGFYAVVEFHPALLLFDTGWKLVYPYSTHGKPWINKEGIGDYVVASGIGLTPGGAESSGADADPAEPFRNPHVAHEFIWGLGDVLSAVLKAGLRIELFDEQYYSNGWKPFEPMQELADRRWTVPDGTPEVPMMYRLRAICPVER